MENAELYELIMNGETKLPSVIGIIPYSNDYKFTFENLELNIRNSDKFEVEKVLKTNNALICDILVNDRNLKMEFYINDTKDLDLNVLNFANKIGKKEIESIQGKEKYIECMTYFDDDVLSSYHIQLKVMDALVPDRGLLVDLSSFTLLSGDWLKMTANSDVCPNPTYLYSVHSVYDDEKGSKKYWFHTHGLHRCGCVELELLEVDYNPQGFLAVINTAAKRFIERGMIRTEEITTIGNDMDFIWLPWEKGLKRLEKGFIFKKNILGGSQDRDDGVHDGPSGILFAIEDKKIVSPNIYAQKLEENPVFFLTTDETIRMSMLAKERIEHFSSIFNFYKDIEGWNFLIKLGYLVDNYEQEDQKEHLWFEVKGIDGDNVDAILINQPYWIARMNENDRGIHDLENLTDWIIYSPEETLTPDTIYRFYQLYGGNSVN